MTESLPNTNMPTENHAIEALESFSSLALECELVCRAIMRGNQKIMEAEQNLVRMREKQAARIKEFATQAAKL